MKTIKLSSKEKELLCWIMLIGALVFMSSFSAFMLLKPQKNYIEVNGIMCEVGFKQTGITSTGAPVGHNIAICPK